MELMHPAVPPLTVLLGAGTLTLAQYRVAPLIWRISGHLNRYAVLEFACLLAIGYVAILPAGPVAPIIAVPSKMLNFTGIVLLGLGGGFLVVGLMLLFRRNELDRPRRRARR
jgi:hypothetical protein